MLLHTFQADLLLPAGQTGAGPAPQPPRPALGLIPASMSGMVDLRASPHAFAEKFYVMVAEQVAGGPPLMHLWELELTSNDGEEVRAGGGAASGETSRSNTPEPAGPGEEAGQTVEVRTRKVGSQPLPLPAGTEVVHCVPAAGHLSSSSIYPACLAPYLLVTACSDHSVRFWRVGAELQWEEWQMEGGEGGDSAIHLPGSPVSVAAAYSGRIAVAYRAGHTFQRKSVNNQVRFSK